jgi:hypothetical protein
MFKLKNKGILGKTKIKEDKPKFKLLSKVKMMINGNKKIES